ncbi:hypothetical protein D3C75_439020 [compost metagenome]
MPAVSVCAGNRSKQHTAFVDIRRQNSDAGAPAFQHIFCYFAVSTHDSRKHGRHELHGIVRLQIGRLEGQHTVSGSMGTREAVIGEPDNHIIHGIRILLLIAQLQAALHEMAALLVQRLTLLLGYRTAQQIRFPEREAGHQGGNLHNLLLVDNYAVRIRQNRRQVGMRIIDRDVAVLAGDELGDKLHRARTVQR